MPWSMDNKPSAVKYLHPKIQRKSIEIANAILREGGDEGTAIATGIKKAKGLVKLAVSAKRDLSTPEDLYSEIISSTIRKNPPPTGMQPDWPEVNIKAQKIRDRYNKYVDYVTKHNKKRGLIGLGIAAGIGAGLGGAYAYKKYKKDTK